MNALYESLLWKSFRDANTHFNPTPTTLLQNTQSKVSTYILKSPFIFTEYELETWSEITWWSLCVQAWWWGRDAFPALHISPSECQVIGGGGNRCLSSFVVAPLVWWNMAITKDSVLFGYSVLTVIQSILCLTCKSLCLSNFIFVFYFSPRKV